MMGGSKYGALRSSGEVEVETALIGVWVATEWWEQLPRDLAIWWLLRLTMLSPFSLPRFFFPLPYCQVLAYTFSLASKGEMCTRA